MALFIIYRGSFESKQQRSSDNELERSNTYRNATELEILSSQTSLPKR
jgi:hypothetical protein